MTTLNLVSYSLAFMARWPSGRPLSHLASSSIPAQRKSTTPSPDSYRALLIFFPSDLWVADTSCSTGCSEVALFEAASSSTFKDLSQPFEIQYGSGQAAGYFVQDVVQMAGFSIGNQEFVAVDQVTSGLLTSPIWAIGLRLEDDYCVGCDSVLAGLGEQC